MPAADAADGHAVRTWGQSYPCRFADRPRGPESLRVPTFSDVRKKRTVTVFRVGFVTKQTVMRDSVKSFPPLVIQLKARRRLAWPNLRFAFPLLMSVS